ncbi:MAG: lytic transglycosylase domain-containing protein [Acidobacteriota bacterium]
MLTNGSVLKVDGYGLVGDDQMRLELASGGVLTLPLERVERIVDDEIQPEPEPLPEPVGFQLGWLGSGLEEGRFAELINAAAERYSLNPVLLQAMMRAESAFDRTAVSHKGARGLLQLMPATAERFGVSPSELFDPERNLEAASKYLVFLRKEFEDELPLVLAAYNAGEGAVRRYGGVPPYKETRNYVQKILRFLGLDEQYSEVREGR